MQLLEALILLLLGAVIGIDCTTFDVLVVGSAAFFTRFSLWVLCNVVLATHIRNRRRAVWWSIPFNLGLVEAYLLCTTFSFENLSRKLMVPFALLALLAPLVTSVAWMVKHDRRNLFGVLTGVLFTVAMLLVTGIVSHGVHVGDILCTILCLACMFIIPEHTFSIVGLDEEGRVEHREGSETRSRVPRRRKSAQKQMDARTARRASRDARRQTSQARRATDGNSGATSAAAAASASTPKDVKSSAVPTVRTTAAGGGGSQNAAGARRTSRAAGSSSAQSGKAGAGEASASKAKRRKPRGKTEERESQRSRRQERAQAPHENRRHKSKSRPQFVPDHSRNNDARGTSTRPSGGVRPASSGAASASSVQGRGTAKAQRPHPRKGTSRPRGSSSRTAR